MHVVELTSYYSNRWSDWSKSMHGNPVYVVAEHIRAIHTVKAKALTEETHKLPVNDRPEETYTYITLGGTDENPLGQMVQETPEEILKAIRFETSEFGDYK